jgi:hypothetical protein
MLRNSPRRIEDLIQSGAEEVEKTGDIPPIASGFSQGPSRLRFTADKGHQFFVETDLGKLAEQGLTHVLARMPVFPEI